MQSLRHEVSDSDRYKLGVAIRETLEKADDPTKDAVPVPNRTGRFTVDLMGYRVAFEVDVDTEGKVLKDATSILLLPVEVIESE